MVAPGLRSDTFAVRAGSFAWPIADVSAGTPLIVAINSLFDKDSFTRSASSSLATKPDGHDPAGSVWRQDRYNRYPSPSRKRNWPLNTGRDHRPNTRTHHAKDGGGS